MYNRLLKMILTSLFLFQFGALFSQTKDTNGKYLLHQQADSVRTLQVKPWKAAAEVVGINTGVWAFSRYLLKADYACIDWNSMKRNISNGFVWDNDKFSTNLFDHPYHGGLYFNAARSNGLSLGGATLYTVGGSLMWEYLMENELPSLNDFVATSIGGVCLGEITFRLSDWLIDDRTSGWGRFGREFCVMLISPVRGLNRIISGDAWKIRNINGRSERTPPVRFYATSGYSGFAESRKNRYEQSMYIETTLFYNTIFSEQNEKPYDAFVFNAHFNFFSNQPLFGNVSALCQIWGENIHLKNKRSDLQWGVFQHFDYYDARAVYKRETINSYKISQVAAFGLGGHFKTNLTERTSFVMSAYLNGVVLGGSFTDYYRVDERDYNLGSGFSAKTSGWLGFGTKAELTATIEKYRLYTWKGYDVEMDFSQLTPEEILYMNVQGDVGSTDFTVSNLKFNYCFAQNYIFSIGVSYYSRNSHYKFFPDVKNKIFESKAGLGYTF